MEPTRKKQKTRGSAFCALTPFTTLDWPGMLCATVFVSECPWNCPYCHNKNLAEEEVRPKGEIEQFIDRRQGLLEGIVFSGGEPTMYEDTVEEMRYARARGFGVALHTGGPFPGRLAKILRDELVDWVGLDYKAPLRMYSDVTGNLDSACNFERSLSILQGSKVEFEVRTTLGDDVADEGTVLEMGRQLREFGVKEWVLQQCREGGVSGGFRGRPQTETMQKWARMVTAECGIKVRVRSSDSDT
ncbi:MAG: anaerobic ribonucleoside-triphosphate reductase activating protein [Planctomycetota bacterium]|nr:anaerobic ribonucleoside-triphosphate reductase activating protein [Planctomycetota bacterium]